MQAAKRIQHFRISWNRGHCRLGSRHCRFHVALIDRKMHQQQARCGVEWVCLHRFVQQLADFFLVAAAARFHLRQGDISLRVFRIKNEHRRIALLCLLGLALGNVDHRQVGYCRQIHRVFGQCRLKTFARVNQFALCQLNSTPHICGQRFVGLLALQSADCLQGLVKLLPANQGVDQRHVRQCIGGRRSNRLELGKGGVRLAFGQECERQRGFVFWILRRQFHRLLKKSLGFLDIARFQMRLGGQAQTCRVKRAALDIGAKHLERFVRLAAA